MDWIIAPPGSGEPIFPLDTDAEKKCPEQMAHPLYGVACAGLTAN